MSLTQTVTDIVAQRGHATADEIHPLVEGVTRKQVMNALAHARKSGLIHCPERAPKRGFGVMDGSEPAVHYPGPNPNRKERVISTRPPNSAWELAHGLQIPGAWPPPFDGARPFNLLSAYDELETAEAA